MPLLKSVDSKHFHSEIPAKPMGKYVHFITIRVTESYPLFQTDGELNKARVRAGIDNSEAISRLAMFKRKQSTPERLTVGNSSAITRLETGRSATTTLISVKPHQTAYFMDLPLVMQALKNPKCLLILHTPLLPSMIPISISH